MAVLEKELVKLESLPLEEQVKELRQQLTLLRSQNVAVLGDGEVFVKRGNDGTIRAVRGVVQLRETSGEIAGIQGKYVTTGTGFYSANRIACLSLVSPDKLTLPDGQIVVNPYPIIDPESGMLRKVWVRRMAVGYGPTGNLTVTSATLMYDLNAYFLQDLIKKIQRNSAAGRVCLEQMLTEKERAQGIFYKFDGPFLP